MKLTILLPTIRERGYALEEEILKNHVCEKIKLIVTRERGEYWNLLNKLIDGCQTGLYVWLADDVTLTEDCFKRGLKEYEKIFQDLQGLLVFNDQDIGDAGAAFGMANLSWNYVLFGSHYFPTGFHHYYLDTLIADRSKELGHYYFAKDVVIRHDHWRNGRSVYDEVYNKNNLHVEEDKARKDQMDSEWRNGGMTESQKRLRQ